MPSCTLLLTPACALTRIIEMIQSHSVIGTDLATGEKEWNVSLAEDVNKTQCHPYFF